MKDSTFKLHPIGIIHKQGDRAWIEIESPYRPAMEGLSSFSHIHVLFWFHENDTPEGRATLQVHPCRNPVNPLTGVFATHSPMRPNLIGLSLCRILGIEDRIIHIEGIDAREGSPLLDIKGYWPYETSSPSCHPDWERS